LDALNSSLHQSPDSFGSYLGAYRKQYGIALGASADEVKHRFRSGIEAEHWAKDASPVYGAIRWYHRSETGANPKLAELYKTSYLQISRISVVFTPQSRVRIGGGSILPLVYTTPLRFDGVVTRTGKSRPPRNVRVNRAGPTCAGECGGDRARVERLAVRVGRGLRREACRRVGSRRAGLRSMVPPDPGAGEWSGRVRHACGRSARGGRRAGGGRGGGREG